MKQSVIICDLHINFDCSIVNLMFEHNKSLTNKKKDFHNNISNTPIAKIKVAKNEMTISKNIVFSGIGLHTGKKVSMTLRPSVEQSGVVFRLISKKKNVSEIIANYKYVSNTFLCTTLSDLNGNNISTTEHILAAVYALGIDNLTIELDSNEVPIMDGSSQAFVKSLKKIDLVEQSSFKKFVKINKKIEVSDGDSYASVTPSEETIISCKLNFESGVIGNQSISFALSPRIFESEICSARTFGFLKDISYLRKKGLTLGGSLDNAIVISNNKILNNDGLRFNDEFVRHKALDFIGDLSLAGHHMFGSFSSYKGGHKLNYVLLNEIFSCEENWSFVDSNLNPIF